MIRKWPCFWFVSIAVFICFAPDLNNNLLNWDDAGYILDNSRIHTVSFETVRWAFSEFYLNYWAPLTWLSLAVDYAIWGTNPVGYHLVNNALHALSAGTAMLICHTLFSAYRDVSAHDRPLKLSVETSLVCSVVTALFFAIHPLRVESVAWATERKDVLSLFFGLPAVLFYLRHVQATGSHLPRVRTASLNYWLSLFFFTLSLLSKSLMITVPVVLLVLDWFPLKRFKSATVLAVILEKIPFFVLSGCAALLTMKAQAKAIASSAHIDLFTRTLNAFKSVMAYLKLTVWPFELSPFYVHPVAIQSVTLAYALPVALVMAITLWCAVSLKRQPIYMAVWLTYLITLFPFLGFTQVGAQAMAGRFTYFSGFPLAVLFGVGVMAMYCKVEGARPKVAVLGAAVALILCVSAYVTVREISFWKDDVTLWTRVIALSPNTGRAYFQRGHAYWVMRDFSRALPDIDTALVIAEQKKYDAMHDIYLLRARVLFGMGEPARAIDDYTRALRTATGETRTIILYERGLAYEKLPPANPAHDDFEMSGTSGRTR